MHSVLIVSYVIVVAFILKLREGSFPALEVTSNPDIVEEEYEQEEDENIEGHEAAGQQEVHLQRIPEIFHQSRQSQP